ncbi:MULTISPECIES: hypothetical protein [Actinokineospora]|uniref:Lipoprotein n=1 Tax=Actinokineospora fastidiosa TaxID=1816 RepID=A0A918GQT1_9PSEU|nr:MULTISPECIES: hypothetical protein [Actinokineospora]UVS77945.1 hypothetical protein Actkin_01668 [Actinokineospora sp. UTMC 2448]GGS50930.1 hypothetical protein GCM10010171_52630 [Actinokineospora fastidiosa]
MTRRIGILVGTALLALATACAEPQSAPEQAPVPPAQSAPADDPADQSGRIPPAGSTPVPDAQLETAALPEGYPVEVWTADGGATLGLGAQEGGCGKASAEVTEQTAEKVAVTIVETTPAKAEVCTMDIRYVTVTAELKEPLGEREVVITTEQRKS